MRLFGRCDPKSGIAPFIRLVEDVMGESPYREVGRVFWIVDNSLEGLAEYFLGFQAQYEQAATPFEWRFTRRDLIRLMKKIHRVTAHPIGLPHSEYVTRILETLYLVSASTDLGFSIEDEVEKPRIVQRSSRWIEIRLVIIAACDEAEAVLDVRQRPGLSEHIWVKNAARRIPIFASHSQANLHVEKAQAVAHWIIEAGEVFVVPVFEIVKRPYLVVVRVKVDAQPPSTFLLYFLAGMGKCICRIRTRAVGSPVGREGSDSIDHVNAYEAQVFTSNDDVQRSRIGVFRLDCDRHWNAGFDHADLTVRPHDLDVVPAAEIRAEI
jgi:hypothetical protein